VAFQPHRYTRTRDLRREFGGAFGDADRVWVLEVYPAGERPIEGVSGRTVVESARDQGAAHVEFAPDAAAAVAAISAEARAGDTVLTLGAGDVWRLGDEVLKQLVLRQEAGAGGRKG
jgi:UDP-N-acetylmuramate--alanine ligase